MKILVNCSTLRIGGGIQVAANFIQESLNLKSDRKFEFLYVVSPEILANLSRETQKLSNLKVVACSPARFWAGRKVRRNLRYIEEQFKPDLIYSVGSPSYTKFRQKEIQRFTVPWFTHPNKYAWRVLNWREEARMRLWLAYVKFSLRNAQFFITQTEQARMGLIEKLAMPSSSVAVVSNSCNRIYWDFFIKNNEPVEFESEKTVKIFTLGAPYPHKNIAIIPEVAEILKKRHINLQFKFLVTLPEREGANCSFWRKARKTGTIENIENVGVLSIQDCLKIFRQSSILFHPSVLETFSATYLEAMAVRIPIVAADLDFAREICKDAALYFTPLSPVDAAEKIIQLVESVMLRTQLIRNAERRFKYYMEKRNSFEETLKIFENIILDI